jgi:hypothetical protein
LEVDEEAAEGMAEEEGESVGSERLTEILKKSLPA